MLSVKCDIAVGKCVVLSVDWSCGAVGVEGSNTASQVQLLREQYLPLCCRSMPIAVS